MSNRAPNRQPLMPLDEMNLGAKLNGATSYDQLRPIMDQCQSTVSSKDFYWAVNLAFHEVESDVYVAIHSVMIATLRQTWSRLLASLLCAPARSLDWLDIGCGPGVLGSLLNERLGNRIRCALFLDPSAAMIAKCRGGSTAWDFDSEFLVGTISDVPRTRRFNLVTADSVLHHVVELEDFCLQVQSLVAPGGYFATCFDPRAEAAEDPTLALRRALCKGFLSWRLVRPILGRVYRRLRRLPPPENRLEEATNKRLLEAGVIRRHLDIHSIWAVTDFHVPGQPGRFGRGIERDWLASRLSRMAPQEYFTYYFFTDAKLVWPFTRLERRLYNRRDPHGMLFGSGWERIAD